VSIDFIHDDGTPAGTTVRRYPGGEFLLNIGIDNRGDEIAFVRTATPDDLVALAVWANSVRRLGGNPVGFVPYLPGARADHADRSDGFDAAAYARILDAAYLAKLICVDPHSPVMPRRLDRCTVIEAVDIIEHVELPDLAGVIAPDEGARERVSRVAERLQLPMFQALKHRDFETGELSGFTCEPLPPDGAFLVVDDICDGGGTFRGLADATGVGRDRLHLWVSHGIFSGNAAKLADYYSSITTTDSHSGCRNIADARVIDLLPHMLGRLKGEQT
jgi:ribose-phosphate pyrophosphokinase